MAFDRENVSNLNIISEGTTETSQLYAMVYGGPLTNFTDSGQASTELKSYLMDAGLKTYDILWVRSSTATTGEDTVLYGYISDFSVTVQTIVPIGGSSNARRTFFAGTFATRTALNTWATANLTSLFNNNMQVTVANVTTPDEELEWVGVNMPTTYDATAWQNRHSSSFTPRTDEDIRKVSYQGFNKQGALNINIATDFSNATFQANVPGAQEPFIMYSGVSTTNNPATIPSTQLTPSNFMYQRTTNQDGSAPLTTLFVPELDSTQANAYFMIFMPVVYAIGRVLNFQTGTNLAHNFNITGVRTIGSVQYNYIASGPIRNDVELSLTIEIVRTS